MGGFFVIGLDQRRSNPPRYAWVPGTRSKLGSVAQGGLPAMAGRPAPLNQRRSNPPRCGRGRRTRSRWAWAGVGIRRRPGRQMRSPCSRSADFAPPCEHPHQPTLALFGVSEARAGRFGHEKKGATGNSAPSERMKQVKQTGPPRHASTRAFSLIGLPGGLSTSRRVRSASSVPLIRLRAGFKSRFVGWSQLTDSLFD